MELNEYQRLVCLPVEQEPPLELLSLALSEHVGKLSLTIGKAVMQMPFVPQDIAEYLGDISAICAIISSEFGFSMSSLFVDPATASDMSEELAGAVVSINPAAMMLLMSRFSGEIAGTIHTFETEAQPIDVRRMKLNLSLLAMTASLMADLHGFSYIDVSLKQNLRKIANKFPQFYTESDLKFFAAEAQNLVITS